MKIDAQTLNLLKAFHKIGARVTGSLATGNFRDDWSDIDLQIPEKNWNAAKEIIRNSGLKWIDKGIGGSIGTKDTSVMLDVSYLFDHTPKDSRFDTVTIEGIKFQTW